MYDYSICAVFDYLYSSCACCLDYTVHYDRTMRSFNLQKQHAEDSAWNSRKEWIWSLQWGNILTCLRSNLVCFTLIGNYITWIYLVCTYKEVDLYCIHPFLTMFQIRYHCLLGNGLFSTNLFVSCVKQAKEMEHACSKEMVYENNPMFGSSLLKCLSFLDEHYLFLWDLVHKWTNLHDWHVAI